MMELGKYAETILGCYGLVALVLVLTVAWLMLDGRRLQRELASLEASGLRRRSAQPGHEQSVPEPNTRS